MISTTFRLRVARQFTTFLGCHNAEPGKQRGPYSKCSRLNSGWDGWNRYNYEHHKSKTGRKTEDTCGAQIHGVGSSFAFGVSCPCCDIAPFLQYLKTTNRSSHRGLRWFNNARGGWPLDGNVKPGMWIGRSPRSALISHLYLLGNPPRSPCTARDRVWEAVLLTQGYISITEGSESDEQLICLINPSFSKKNIWSWGADLSSCSYRQTPPPPPPTKVHICCCAGSIRSRRHDFLWKRQLQKFWRLQKKQMIIYWRGEMGGFRLRRSLELYFELGSP